MYGQPQGESIYNLIPRAQVKQVKPKRYQSRFDPKMPPTGSTFGTSGTTRLPGAAVGVEGAVGRKSGGNAGTFGRPIGIAKPNPGSYLKKSGQKSLPKAGRPFVRPDVAKKPAVPSRTDKPVMGLQSTKNYVTANAVEAILAVPGNRASVNEQQPVYRNKVDYAKVPAYLNDVKAEIARENEMIENYIKQTQEPDQDDGDQGEVMSEQERDDLIDALKSKWDVVNQKYQKICHMVKLDTIGKVRRKEAMETELIQLEKDIKMLEGRQVVVC